MWISSTNLHIYTARMVFAHMKVHSNWNLAETIWSKEIQRGRSGQASHMMLRKSYFSRPIKLAFTYAVFSSGICPVLSDGSIHGHPTKYQNNSKSGYYRAYGVRASIVLPGRPCRAVWWKRPRPLCFVSLLSRCSSVSYDGQLLLGVIKTIQVTTVLDKGGSRGCYCYIR